MMKEILLVGTGSFIGGVLRYLVTQLMMSKHWSVFPFGTFAVNILGCFLIGLIIALGDKNFIPLESRLFLATGLCGGFTTFSAFSNETLLLFNNGHSAYAVLYVSLSVAMGVTATYFGYFLIR